jgi:hypothetical protein
MNNFQRGNIKSWNTSFNEVSKYIIPPVSHRDEISTMGYGMAIIEVLHMLGLLVLQRDDDKRLKWTLNTKWNEKRVYFFGN